MGLPASVVAGIGGCRWKPFRRSGCRACEGTVSPDAVSGEESFEFDNFDQAASPDLHPRKLALGEQIVKFGATGVDPAGGLWHGHSHRAVGRSDRRDCGHGFLQGMFRARPRRSATRFTSVLR
jgi:hypothetical protein